MEIKLALMLPLILLCCAEVFGFVFEVKQAAGNSYDNIGSPIQNGQRTDTFSMMRKLDHEWVKGPCVIVTATSKGVRLMAYRGGMIMVFREGMVIYGTHRHHFSKSRPSSGSRSPKNVTPTRSGSVTPPVFRTKDGSFVERRQPKIPPKDRVFMNSASFENPNTNVPKRRTSRTANNVSPLSSFEISSSPKSFQHISSQASLEVRPYVPISAEASSSQGPSSSEGDSTPLLLKTSESKGAPEHLIEHYAPIPKAKIIEATKYPTKARSRSQSFSPPERAKSCKERSREVLISSDEIGFKKSVSSPLSVSEKRRRKIKLKVPKLELTPYEGSGIKRSSSTIKSSPPRKGSGSNSSPRSFSTSPRSLGESPRHTLLEPNFSAEISPRSPTLKDSSGSNSRQSSPRSSLEASFYKNIDISVQLEFDDLILIVIPNQDVDASAVLDMYLSASDKLEEIDPIKFLTVGHLGVLKVTEPMEQSRPDCPAKHRANSYSTTFSTQDGPELTKLSK